MYTLGINAAFHDSSACLVKDGSIIAAAEEERFSHVKHAKRPVPFSTYELPFHAIDYCLSVANLHLNDVDHFAYSFDPQLFPVVPVDNSDGNRLNAWDPFFLSYVVNARSHLVDGWPHHLQRRFIGADIPEEKWSFVAHHLAHAASAFHVSPYEEAAVMTIDGRGEKATTAYYIGSGYDLKAIGQVDMPHSLGLLYERLTTHLGFLHSSDEFKVMALASYGAPTYTDVFRSIIHVGDDGTYTIDDVDLADLLGPRRLRADVFERRHFDMAHSLQIVLQDTVLALVQWLHKRSGSDTLCLAGGVALNCVMNAWLRDHGPFRNIWVQPAAGDAGTALGAAMWQDAQIRKPMSREFVMGHAYWGPEYDDADIEKFLMWAKVPYRKMKDVAAETAKMLAADKIIGWYQGRMEFGPRALGGRSILASPLNANMQARLNEVKDREDFRPVAPAVLEEDAGEWFEGARYSPFMLFVYSVLEDVANRIPAVRHVDGTARIQTVNKDQHPLYYALLKEFKALTGVPVLINTSFNTLGKPIVCSPRDALECFWTSPFDALVMGSFLIEKDDQSGRGVEVGDATLETIREEP